MEGLSRERFKVEVAGRDLAVEEMRPPTVADGPALVFLHEGLGSIAMWRRLPTLLAGRLGLRAIAYDRAGHGDSGPPAGPRDARYLHEEAEAVLPALLDRLGVPAAIHVGHSDGGTIALLHAAAEPARVRALVAIAAHVFVEDVALEGIRRAVAGFEAGDLGPRLTRFHGPATEALFRAWSGTWLAPWFRDWNIEAALPAIEAPVLVIQGESDPYGGPLQAEAMRRGLRSPAQVALLPGLGHSPHLEAPDRIADAIAAFLERKRQPTVYRRPR